jgi:hypothetical protein
MSIGIPGIITHSVQVQIEIKNSYPGFVIRVARFFLTQHTKTKENVPNYQNITKRPKNVPNDRKIFQNGHKIYQHFPFK